MAVWVLCLLWCAFGFHASALPFDPCIYHRIIADDTVAEGLVSEPGAYRSCDRTMLEDWYRIGSSLRGYIPTSCVPPYQCSTIWTVWINGSIPRVDEGVVEMQACVSQDEGCCQYNYTVAVKNCGSFPVYWLTYVPGCPIAYCYDILGPDWPTPPPLVTGHVATPRGSSVVPRDTSVTPLVPAASPRDPSVTPRSPGASPRDPRVTRRGPGGIHIEFPSPTARRPRKEKDRKHPKHRDDKRTKPPSGVTPNATRNTDPGPFEPIEMFSWKPVIVLAIALTLFSSAIVVGGILWMCLRPKYREHLRISPLGNVPEKIPKKAQLYTIYEPNYQQAWPEKPVVVREDPPAYDGHWFYVDGKRGYKE